MSRTSQIPGFGNWEYVNELPITQYFESARQAGLIRYSSSGECDHPYNYSTNYTTGIPNHNLYNLDYVKPRIAPSKQAKGCEKKSTVGTTHMREGSNKKQARKVFDVTVTEVPQAHVIDNKRHSNNSVSAVKKKQQQFQYDAVLNTQTYRSAPKAVDEDLYKIPPELLKKKRRLGFFSRCLVAPCAV